MGTKLEFAAEGIGTEVLKAEYKAIRAKLTTLYAKSLKAAGPLSVAAIEAEITSLETAAAELMF